MGIMLREDVAFCIANKRVALLDLRNERYFCLPDLADAAFQSLLNNADSDPDLGTAPLSCLAVRGLLIQTNRTPSAAFAPTVYTTAVHTLDLSDIVPTTSGICLALLSQAGTHVSLKRQSLQKIVGRVRGRRLSNPISAPDTISSDIRTDIASFHFTKRLLSNQDQCLRRSLALVDFLASRHYYPDLVIGVRLAPFSFHAWVQLGDIVLNDEADTVRPYTPILVV